MKTLMCAAAAIGMCVGSLNLALAKQDHGMSGRSPGHEMQKHGSVSGSPGASGYARGHLYTKQAIGTEIGWKIAATAILTAIR